MKTYDPTKVCVTVGTHTVSGYAEGSLVKCARNEDSFKLTVGGDGQSVRSKSPNRSGKITLTLLQSSASNEYLSSMAVLDETGSAGAVAGAIVAPLTSVVPVTIKDLNGLTIWETQEAWVMKPPESSWDKEAKDREWVLEAAVLKFSERGY